MDSHKQTDELDGLLRRAVDAVRSEPIPQDAIDRATDRARQQMAKLTPKRPRARLFSPIAAGIAAAACICFTAVAITQVGVMGRPLIEREASQLRADRTGTGRLSSEAPIRSNSIAELGLESDVPVKFENDRLGDLGRPLPGLSDPVADKTPNVLVPTFKHVGNERLSEVSPELKDARQKYSELLESARRVPGSASKDDIEGALLRLESLGGMGPGKGDASVKKLLIVSGEALPGIGGAAKGDFFEKRNGVALKIADAKVVGGEGLGVEAYSHYKDIPFLRSVANPLSTFSIAVDTASYSNVRRFLLAEKRLPPPDAVRVAELINYFPYQYEQPKGENPVAFHLDLANCPWQPKHHLVRVALKGKELDPKQLPPRNFVFLIDTSGSMDVPNRLPLLKTSLTLLVEQLTANDRVSMVAYAGSAGLVLPATAGNDKTTILKALDNLSAGGSTNGGDGIQLAYKIARGSFIKGGINRVILGTDGDFNVGVTSEGDLVRLIEEERKSGVFLTILGYGMGNLKDATMERLAHHGSGHFAYIDSLAEARKVFVEQGCSLVTIAKDVKLQVEFNPQTVGAYRLIGYENKLMRAEDFNDDKKHAGDMGSGHTVTALYEIVPVGLPVPGEKVDALKYQKPVALAVPADGGEWLTVKMRYKDPQADTSKLLSQALKGGVKKLADAPADFRFAAAAAEFGLLLRDTEFRGGASYKETLNLAKEALGKDENGHRKEFLKLVEAGMELAGKTVAPR